MDIARLKNFIEPFWDDSILPSITEYIRIPNKSPAFDPQWSEHGYMEDAVKLMEAWARPQLAACGIGRTGRAQGRRLVVDARRSRLCRPLGVRAAAGGQHHLDDRGRRSARDHPRIRALVVHDLPERQRRLGRPLVRA